MRLQDQSKSVDVQELQRWMGQVKVLARQTTSELYSTVQYSELVTGALNDKRSLDVTTRNPHINYDLYYHIH